MLGGLLSSFHSSSSSMHDISFEVPAGFVANHHRSTSMFSIPSTSHEAKAVTNLCGETVGSSLHPPDELDETMVDLFGSDTRSSGSLASKECQPSNASTSVHVQMISGWMRSVALTARSGLSLYRQEYDHLDSDSIHPGASTVLPYQGALTTDYSCKAIWNDTECVEVELSSSSSSGASGRENASAGGAPVALMPEHYQSFRPLWARMFEGLSSTLLPLSKHSDTASSEGGGGAAPAVPAYCDPFSPYPTLSMRPAVSKSRSLIDGNSLVKSTIDFITGSAKIRHYDSVISRLGSCDSDAASEEDTGRPSHKNASSGAIMIPPESFSFDDSVETPWHVSASTMECALTSVTCDAALRVSRIASSSSYSMSSLDAGDLSSASTEAWSEHVHIFQCDSGRQAAAAAGAATNSSDPCGDVNFFYSEDSEEGCASAKVHASAFASELMRFDSGGDIDWFIEDK